MSGACRDSPELPTPWIVVHASEKFDAEGRKRKSKRIERRSKPGTDRLEVGFLESPKPKKAHRAFGSGDRTQDFDFRSGKIVPGDLKIRFGRVDFFHIDADLAAVDKRGRHQAARVSPVEINVRQPELLGYAGFPEFAGNKPPLMLRVPQMKFQHAAQQRMRCNKIGPVMIETEAVGALTFVGVKNL